MIKSFSIPLFLTLGVALGGMTGCDDADDSAYEQTAETPVVLKGKVYKLGDKECVAWHNAEEVGVYMVNAATGSPVGDYQNVKCIADNRSSNGYLVPANNQPLFLPEDQTPVKLIAYYPYSEQLGTRAGSGQLFHLDLTSQNIETDSFLYSNEGVEVSTANNKQEIGLKSALSKIEVDVIPGNGLSAKQVEAMSLRLTEMPAVADFDILYGKFDYLSFQALAMKQSSNDKNKQSCVTFPAEISETMQVEATFPGEDNKLVVMNLPLKTILAALNANTQYNVSLKVSREGMSGELVSESPLVIFDWQDDVEVEGNVTPESFDLINQGNFESLASDQLHVGASLPKEAGVWYGLANKVDGKFKVLNDSEQHKYLSMQFTGKLNWYSNYLGYMLPNLAKGHYLLTFKAKADKKDSKLQVYTRINKSGNHFFTLEKAAESESAAAQTITLSEEWNSYTVAFDLTQSVNTIYARDKVITAVTEDDLKSSFLAFGALQEQVNYAIDDVVLTPLK